MLDITIKVNATDFFADWDEDETVLEDGYTVCKSCDRKIEVDDDDTIRWGICEECYNYFSTNYDVVKSYLWYNDLQKEFYINCVTNSEVDGYEASPELLDICITDFERKVKMNNIFKDRMPFIKEEAIATMKEYIDQDDSHFCEWLRGAIRKGIVK